MPDLKWYDIKAASDDIAEVWIYGEIGEDLSGKSIAAKRFIADLDALKVGEIALHINSHGGSVFDGQAIYTALKRHPADITTYIDGLAASIASVVALAGDRVIMPSNAMMVIHDPWALAIGSSGDMRKMADTLDKVAETILNVYDERSPKTREELAAAMAAETWLTAAEAAEYGFADEVTAEMRIAASFDLSRFRNAPDDWQARVCEGAAQTKDTASGDAEDPPASPAEGADEAGKTVLPPGVVNHAIHRPWKGATR